MGRVIRDEQIQKDLERIRKHGRIVFTNGCFDLLHVGHIRYLQQARSLGDFLFVGINSDRSVQELKGPTRPIQNESDRAEIMAALGCVDFVCVFDEDTPERLIKQVRPDVLTKGGDWPIEKIVGYDFVQSYGGQVKSLQFVEGRSTSSIVEKSKSGT